LVSAIIIVWLGKPAQILHVERGVGGKVGAACPNIPLEGMAISYS